MDYTCLEQRMAQGLLALFPPFVPGEDAPVSVSEQETFYRLIKGIYQRAYDAPSILVATLHEDDAYPFRFNKVAYQKPELQVNAKKYMKTVEAVVEKLFKAAKGEAVKLSRREKDMLTSLEVTDLSNLPPACRWMATRTDASLHAFSHCFFKKDYPYAEAIYSALFNSEGYGRLVDWMKQSGYQPFMFQEILASDCKLSLTYANPAWSQEAPAPGFEYKMRHSGISMCFDALIKEPCVLGVCIPNGMKPYLERFDDMEPHLKAFVLQTNKKCDGCCYCVQTDKTGCRPLACIPAVHKNEPQMLCPYFPGFNYCWTHVTPELADNIIALLTFMDQFACKRAKR